MKAFTLAGPSAWKLLSPHLIVKHTLLKRLSVTTLCDIEPLQWALSSHQIHPLNKYLLTLIKIYHPQHYRHFAQDNSLPWRAAKVLSEIAME